jgi:hypothetical protein
MNQNHKPGNAKNPVNKNVENTANVNTPKAGVKNEKKDIKNIGADGAACEVNPVKGISYLPPKDENTL